MGNSWFQFQQFRIQQDRCAMKISTDAVLLGALAFSENPLEILDIGTGTGVVALMLAQRFSNSKIQAVEIDEDAADQADENFQNSPFSERITLFKGRFQEFQDSKGYDLIVSNPPYFSDHLKSTDSKRNKALHTDELSFEDLATKVRDLLHPKGEFWVILPPRQMEDLRKILKKELMFEKVVYQIRDRQESKILREVSSFSFLEGEIIRKEMVIKAENGGHSSDYKKLISGFLLGF